MSEKRFKVIMKCENKKCEYFIETDGIETSIKDILNEKYELEDMNKKLKEANTILRSSRKSCEKGRIQDRKSFESFDKMRLRRIRFLERRLSENGLSYYENEDAQGNRIV